MGKQKFKFSKAALDKLKNSTGTREQYFDTIQHGLCIRVTPAGTKTFRVDFWDSIRKKPLRETIGKYPGIDIATAREFAASRLADISKGIDINERNRQAREEQTLDEVYNDWLEDYAKENNKRWKQDKSRYELYIQPHFGNKKISAITSDSIVVWRRKLLKQKKQRGDGLLTKSTVQRAVVVLSSIYSNSAKQVPNPCSDISHYKPKCRNVFLKTDDLSRFFKALESEETPEYLRDYLLLSLYTGARKSNVLSMKWNHVDLNLKLWIIPGDETKNEEPMVVPLLDQAVEVLSRRKKGRISIFVFPSPRKSKTGHYTEPKKGWKNLLERASLSSDYRLHDIRRTMGSWQAITGSSTKIIGASLGHKSEQATAHYAHLTIDPVRKSMERAAAAMNEARNAPDKVVKIRKD
jgi:integrase